MNKSKVSVATNQIWGVIESILGWVLAAVSFLVIVSQFSGPKSESFMGVVITYLVFLAIGIIMIRRGKKRKKLINDFKNYVQILAEDPYNSLDTIAEQSNSTIDEVKKNVQQMIKKNYFANAVIDEASNTLILNGTRDAHQILKEKARAPKIFYIATPAPPVEMLTVKCPGCGGINAVPRGKVIECEYCGNMLKGE